MTPSLALLVIRFCPLLTVLLSSKQCRVHPDVTLPDNMKEGFD